eukprot:gene4059-4438_t
MEIIFILYKALYFVLFSGYGILMPYTPVFFEVLSMSKTRIGILTMLPNICSFVMAPIFAAFGDAFDLHNEVVITALVYSTIATLAMLLPSTFLSTFLIVLAASTFRAPISPQVDAMVIHSLSDKTRYGEMRLWGAIGYGIFSFLGGAITQDHSLASFANIFYIHVGLFIVTVYIYAGLLYKTVESATHDDPKSEQKTNHTSENSKTNNNSKVVTAMGNVIKEHPAVLIFSLIVFLSGVGSGVIDSFLFLRLKQLGGSGLVMGISRFITCAAEVPMFQIAGRLHQRYGTWKMLAVTQLAFVVRFSYYSSLRHPWAVLPCEMLHGLTFAVMWSVSCTYANRISPPDCHGTMQALLKGLHSGLGGGVGALIGGFVYDSYGAVWLFEMSGMLALCSLVLSIFACIFAAPDNVVVVSENNGGGSSSGDGYAQLAAEGGEEVSLTQCRGDEEEEDIEGIALTGYHSKR